MSESHRVLYAARQSERKANGAARWCSLGRQTAADLMLRDLPDVSHVVPGFVAEGVTVLAGKSKLGKSWWALGVAIAVATPEGVAFGTVPVEHGDVLYLGLEDNERRLQRRLNQLLPTGYRPERLFYDITCRRLDDGLLDDLREWIERVPNPRLIIIDVLNRVKPQQRGNESLYDYDVRCLEGLQGLAAESGLAIVVVHHTRKAEADDPFDCVSGSIGLTGTADATLVLARDSQGTTLYGRGRDIEEIEVAMSFDRTTGHWTLLGEAADVRRTDQRTTLLKALRDGGEPMSPADLASATGMDSNNVRQLLFKMVKAGEAEKTTYGHYVCPVGTGSAPIAPHNTDNSNSYRRARDGADDE